MALETQLTPHFAMWEFMDVDLFEPAPLRRFPRYVPCAVTSLAAHLEVLREQIGSSIHISANGGYRSPSHGKSIAGSPHCWGTAANIYRIGDQYLDERETIEKYCGARHRAFCPRCARGRTDRGRDASTITCISTSATSRPCRLMRLAKNPDES